MLTASENGTTTIATYAYNPLSQRTGLTYQAAADTMTYTWTTAGDMLTLAHSLGGTANDNTYTYTYYNSHQVATDAASIAAWKWQSSVTGTVPYGAANNLNQYPSVNGQTISHDTRGNMTGDGVFTYTYDAENRMLTASRTGPIVNATFAYDPLGRRVKKSTGGGGATTYYVSDGADEIAEYTGFTANTLQRRYVPGPAIDQPIAMVTSAGVRTFFHTDKRGSVIAMSDSSGNINEGPFTYDACGNMSGSTTGEPFRYAGRRYDSETGLLYNRARYLSNALCRFLQTDPVGYRPDMNLYTYVDNDPTDKVDPTGLEAVCMFTSGGCEPSGDAFNATATFVAPFQPALTFFSGIGPKQQEYGHASYMARSAQQSLAVGIARQRVYRALDEGRQPRNPMGVYFGPGQYAVAALRGDTFSHVMGSVEVSAQQMGENQIQFSVTNYMTTSSLLEASAFRQLAKMPEVAKQIEQLNHNVGPGATVKITVTWTEKLEKHTCTGSRIPQYGPC